MAQGNLLMQFDRDWDRAEAEFQQAVALDPSTSEVRRWYAMLLTILQRFGEAKKQYQAAIEQDPLNVVPRLGLVSTSWLVGDLGATEAQLRQLAEDFPEEPLPRWNLVAMYAFTGRPDDAFRTMRGLPTTSDVNSRLFHATVMAWLGRPEEGREFLAEWQAGRLAKGLDADALGMLCSCMGDYEGALALLEQSQREGGPGPSLDYQNPAYDPIRDDPRFVGLLESMHLPTTLPRPRIAPPAQPS